MEVVRGKVEKVVGDAVKVRRDSLRHHVVVGKCGWEGDLDAGPRRNVAR